MTKATLLKFKEIYEKSGNSVQLAKVNKALSKYPAEEIKPEPVKAQPAPVSKPKKGV